MSSCVSGDIDMLFEVKSSHDILNLFGVGNIRIVKVDVHVSEDAQLKWSRCAKVRQERFAQFLRNFVILRPFSCEGGGR